MHELSIAVSLIELAEEEAARRGAQQIRALHLRLGPLSGVVKEALLFSWEVARDETKLSGAELVIEEVPLIVWCESCREEQTLASMQEFCCPRCYKPTPEVISGRELELVAMEIGA